MIEIGQVIVENQLIAYRVQKGGPLTVIFLHGWRSNADVWKECIDHLDVARVTSYALNLPGFGGSEVPKYPFGVSEYERIVVGFMKKIDIPSAIIVGHSFGGRIALVMGAKHPELVMKLILVDSAGLRLPSMRRTFFKYFSRIVRPIFSLRSMQGIRHAVYRFLGADDYVTSPELQETFVKVIDENLEPLLPSISAPTLIVWGKNDTDTPLAFAHILNEKIRSSKLRVYEDAGHFSFLDKPGQFVDDVTAFIQ